MLSAPGGIFFRFWNIAGQKQRPEVFKLRGVLLIYEVDDLFKKIKEIQPDNDREIMLNHFSSLCLEKLPAPEQIEKSDILCRGAGIICDSVGGGDLLAERH